MTKTIGTCRYCQKEIKDNQLFLEASPEIMDDKTKSPFTHWRMEDCKK